MDAYICSPLALNEPSPSAILSKFLGKDVYLTMKGPTPRECPPTRAFANLQANSVFQVWLYRGFLVRESHRLSGWLPASRRQRGESGSGLG